MTPTRDVSIFRASELDAGASGWRVSVHTPGQLFDERGWKFRTRKEARDFAQRVRGGEDPHGALREIQHQHEMEV